MTYQCDNKAVEDAQRLRTAVPKRIAWALAAMFTVAALVSNCVGNEESRSRTAVKTTHESSKKAPTNRRQVQEIIPIFARNGKCTRVTIPSWSYNHYSLKALEGTGIIKDSKSSYHLSTHENWSIKGLPLDRTFKACAVTKIFRAELRLMN